MNNEEYYKGKICIVSGANSGIGYAISQNLLKNGATVYMLGRNQERVENAVNEIEKYDGKAYPLIADVSKKEEYSDKINYVADKEGQLDFLFNNAGIGSMGPTEKFTIEDWEKIIAVNLWSVIYGVTTALPIMNKQKSGHIINTGSIEGIIPIKYQAQYNTTKYAVVGLSESIRQEYLDKGIKCSVICPGFVNTSIFKKKMGNKVSDKEKQIIEEAIKKGNPMDPEDVAKEALNKIADNESIIVIPEQPWTKLWQGYILKNPEAEQGVLEVSSKIQDIINLNKN